MSFTVKNYTIIIKNQSTYFMGRLTLEVQAVLMAVY